MNQVRAIDNVRLVRRLGALDADALRRVDLAIQISLGLLNCKPLVLDDRFRTCVPANGAAQAKALERHAAGDGNAVTQFERAVRFS